MSVFLTISYWTEALHAAGSRLLLQNLPQIGAQRTFIVSFVLTNHFEFAFLSILMNLKFPWIYATFSHL